MIETLLISDVKLNKDNPRFIRDERYMQLKKSIQEFPEMVKLRMLVIDENNVILGGNMRYRAMAELGYKKVECIIAKGLTEEQKREFIIKDNVNFGDWDWAAIANDWDAAAVEDWGLVIPGVEDVPQGEEFQLPDGEKAPFQQMTFSMANEQATLLQNALADIKATEEYKYVETFGNENSNGNALYLLVMQWTQRS